MLAAGCRQGDKLDKMWRCRHLTCFYSSLSTRFAHFEAHSVNRYAVTLPNSFFGLGNLPLSSLNSQPQCGETLDPTLKSDNMEKRLGSMGRLHVAALQGFRWMQRVCSAVDLGSQREAAER